MLDQYDLAFCLLKDYVESMFNGGNNFSSTGSVLARAAGGTARRGARAGSLRNALQ